MTTIAVRWKDLSSIHLPEGEERLLHEAIEFIASTPKLDSSAASHLERMIRLAESALCKLAEQDALHAIKAQTASVAVPDGYALVPIDATRQMIDAAVKVDEKGYDAMHKAMIAAAHPPVSGQQKPEFYVDHDLLRKALGMYGIAAPESDHELGDRMESYAIKVIKAVARLPFPAAQGVSGLVEALEDITDDYADRFDMESPSTNPGMKVVVENARKALAAHRAQQGEQP